MFNEAIADSMAEAGGIGISDVIMNQLEGDAAILADRPASSRLTALGAIGAPGNASELTLPVSGRKSSSFGSRIHPISGERRFHSGLDIAAATGTPVSAAADGVVKRAGRAGGYGNLVVAARVVAIVSPQSAPMRRLREEATGRGKLVDATQGRRTRSILVTDSDHVVLSAVNPETIAARLTQDGFSSPEAD